MRATSSTRSASHTGFSVECVPHPASKNEDDDILVMEVQPNTDDRIKELCAKALNADDSEVPIILAELKSLLEEHSAFVRYMVARTLNGISKAA
jgi:hypothetical protein